MIHNNDDLYLKFGLAPPKKNFVPAMFDELPCEHRVSVHDVEIPAECCGASATAMIEAAYCTLFNDACTVTGKPVEGHKTRPCLGCKKELDAK